MTATTGTNTNLINYQMQILSEAAYVRVGGRVMNNTGRGIGNALVALTNQNGEVQFARTNSFGIYEFGSVGVGVTYTINVKAKEYQFAPQMINVTGELSNLNIIAP